MERVSIAQMVKITWGDNESLLCKPHSIYAFGSDAVITHTTDGDNHPLLEISSQKNIEPILTHEPWRKDRYCLKIS